MAAGILDAGGRNATIGLRSRSGHFRCGRGCSGTGVKRLGGQLADACQASAAGPRKQPLVLPRSPAVQSPGEIGPPHLPRPQAHRGAGPGAVHAVLVLVPAVVLHLAGGTAHRADRRGRQPASSQGLPGKPGASSVPLLSARWLVHAQQPAQRVALPSSPARQQRGPCPAYMRSMALERALLQLAAACLGVAAAASATCTSLPVVGRLSVESRPARHGSLHADHRWPPVPPCRQSATASPRNLHTRRPSRGRTRRTRQRWGSASGREGLRGRTRLGPAVPGACWDSWQCRGPDLEGTSGAGKAAGRARVPSVGLTAGASACARASRPAVCGLFSPPPCLCLSAAAHRGALHHGPRQGPRREEGQGGGCGGRRGRRRGCHGY